MKETTYGGLADMMPRTITDHYIEAYYGSELVFTGFMQCQEFDDDWVAVPRELEFPIISPLGLLDAFNFTVPAQPGLVTLGSLMYEVMTGLNAGYTDVVYPVEGSYEPWDNVMSSTVMVPFNESFKHYDLPAKLFEPRDYRYFVEGICACFGWLVHDTPTSVEFTKYNYNGSYSRLTLGGLINPGTGWSGVQQRAAAFSDYYSNADNNAMQSVVMPLKQVNLNLEGVDIKDKKLSTDHTVTHGYMGGSDVSREVSLTQVGPDVDGNYLGTAIFDTGGEISGSGVYPIGYGKVEANAKTVNVSESWVIKYSSGWSEGDAMITAIFYGMMPKNSMGYSLIRLKMERGTSLQDMKSTNYNDVVMNMVIKQGSSYYDLGTDNWTSYFTLNQITIDGQTGKVTPNKSFPTGGSIGPYTEIGDIDGILFTLPAGIDKPLEVSLRCNSTSNLADGEYLRITDMSIANPGDIEVPYNEYYRDRNKIVVGNNATGTAEKDITVNFNNYVGSRGEHSFGDETYGPTGGSPTMPYLFAPMTVLTEKVKRKSTPDFDEYAAKWTYWINGWRWRMIAWNFSLRDDIYQITLARSSTIE